LEVRRKTYRLLLGEIDEIKTRKEMREGLLICKKEIELNGSKH
jgi:hypothetical protein